MPSGPRLPSLPNGATYDVGPVGGPADVHGGADDRRRAGGGFGVTLIASPFPPPRLRSPSPHNAGRVRLRSQ